MSVTAWDEASEKARNFVYQLTISEKIGLATGSYGSGPFLPCVGTLAPVERFNYSGMCFSDGPNGVNRADGVSVFASGITVAATWDRRLMYERGLALGEEFRVKGVHVALGYNTLYFNFPNSQRHRPSTGPMGRHARGGRNWEDFGPDPYLAGVAMNESVSGVEAKGVQTSSKHYIGNEQETQRNPSTRDDATVIDAISANIDDRTLHKLYLCPFTNALYASTVNLCID
jgi:beta-glucosidase